MLLNSLELFKQRINIIYTLYTLINTSIKTLNQLINKSWILAMSKNEKL